jgi:hypothetical protein
MLYSAALSTIHVTDIQTLPSVAGPFAPDKIRQSYTITFSVLYGQSESTAHLCIRALTTQGYGLTSITMGACPHPTFPTKPFKASVKLTSPKSNACVTLTPYELPSPLSPPTCALSGKDVARKLPSNTSVSSVKWCLCAYSKADFVKGVYHISTRKC